MRILYCCLNGISNNPNQDNSNLFQTMFPDSKIAKSLQMGPNKIRYSIKHGFGLYFRGLLTEVLNRFPWLVASFDEPLNKKPKHGKWVYLLDTGMRKRCKLKVLELLFMRHCTSHDLKNPFNEG